LHKRDLSLLSFIKTNFGIGFINKNTTTDIKYLVNSYIENKNIIIPHPHFEKYPFPIIAHKYQQYVIWK